MRMVIIVMTRMFVLIITMLMVITVVIMIVSLFSDTKAFAMHAKQKWYA